MTQFQNKRKMPFKETILSGFQPEARKTFDLIHHAMENVRGLKDLLPHKRGLLAVDRKKLDLLDKFGKADSQMTMFICDYDKQYAHKVLNGLCEAMRDTQPLTLDAIKQTHLLMCAGSTDFDTNAAVTGEGFSETGMSYLLMDGMHCTDAGWSELRAFRSRIDVMKTDFLSLHPDMTPEMKNCRILMEHKDGTTMFGRTAMPEAFLEYCCHRWLQELQTALAGHGDHNDPDGSIRKRAIIRFCKDCENLHPFADGNGRVFALAMPLRLFNDLHRDYLPVLDFPGRLDGHSTDELLVRFDEAIAFVNREWRAAS